MSQEPQNESADRLLTDPYRIPIEQCVSNYLGRAWRVTRVQDKVDEASHPAAVLSDETDSVFVKLGEGRLARDQLKQELAGLRLLTERGEVLTPAIIGNIPLEGGALVVMEAVQVIQREHVHWRQIGEALARLHATRGTQFGLETHCYWGSLYQNNSPLPDWPEFFWERRLVPRLRAAVDSGRLPLDFVPKVEMLRDRLPSLCGPQVEPSLLHGDAHQNNFLSTARGPFMIDPSVYYGHPEIDLAHVDFFAPVSDALRLGYQASAPLDPGFKERRDLWRIPTWLAMVQVVGPQHLPDLTAALQSYQ